MVIFFDIDGTLVDEETQIIPQSTVRAIHQLRESGHMPIINTGRPYSHLDPRVRALPFAGWVCAGGMEVFLDGKWLQKLHMSREMSRWVIGAVRDCRMQVIFEVEGGFLLDGALSSCPSFKGTSENTFSPDESLTRAMLVTILYRLEGEPATNRSIPFADVDISSYYANPVIWAKQTGIVYGVSENYFAPDEIITREQFAAIMYRYAALKGKDVHTT